jgi:hypothetical protein
LYLPLERASILPRISLIWAAWTLISPARWERSAANLAMLRGMLTYMASP